MCWYCGLGRKQESIELLNQPEPPLLKDLEKFVALRDLFAHVPVSWFAKELEFDENSRYNHFFKLNEKWRNISFALKEFMSLQEEILNLITAYIKSVVLKREIYSNILLGESYNEVLEDVKNLENKDKNNLS